MDSEASTADEDGVDHLVSRSSKTNHDKDPRKAEKEKDKCRKVPRKIHKAEREKQKRDNMNTLFSELAKVLEPSSHDYGKACVLRETIRLVGELMTQVDSLRKENTALSSESHYMIIEKDELKEEKCAMEAQIESLQAEIDERIHSQTTNLGYCQAHNITSLPQVPEELRTSIDGYVSPSTAATGPVLVVPLHNDHQMYGGMAEKALNVSRPRPRYPSPSDSWPSHVLNGHPTTTDNS